MAQQNDEPPAGMYDDVPPPSDDGRGGDVVQRGGGGGRRRREEPQFNVAAETRAFYAAIDDHATQAEIKKVLPDHIDIGMYVRVAKTAATSSPSLLNPEWRGSLMRALAKAAAQGLLPDGKEGALIARWDEQARAKQVCWQPMVWGITKLGRLTGQIQKIYASLVFEGEVFEVLGGEDEGKIIHKINPDIVDAAYAFAGDPAKFWGQVKAAYCIITPVEGDKVIRWMPRNRILKVKATSKAANGPWNGPFSDEMGIKTIIHWTCKWLDLNINNDFTRRFREALDTDMEADFDHAGNLVEQETGTSGQLALAAPTPKLDNIMDQLNRRREAETVGGGGTQQSELQQTQTATKQDNQPATGGGQGETGSAAPVAGDQKPPATAAAPGGGTKDAAAAPSASADRRQPPPPANDQHGDRTTGTQGARQDVQEGAKAPAAAQQPPQTQKAPTPSRSGGSAPVTAPTTAEQFAREFVDGMKQAGRLVASTQALNKLFGTPKALRGVARLQESFPKLYDELMGFKSGIEQDFGPPDAGNDAAGTGRAA